MSVDREQIKILGRAFGLVWVAVTAIAGLAFLSISDAVGVEGGSTDFPYATLGQLGHDSTAVVAVWEFLGHVAVGGSWTAAAVVIAVLGAMYGGVALAILASPFWLAHGHIEEALGGESE